MPFWSRRSSVSSTSEEKDLSSSDDLSSSAADGSSPITNASVANNNNQPHPSMHSTTTSSQVSPESTTMSTKTSNNSYDNAIVTEETWTKIFPEAFGIRRLIEESSFRWCWRESSMWGIATGTVMYFHRRRMGSRNLFAGGVAYGTMILVFAPSYYFCYRKREHQEHVIEMMMAANDFLPGEEMPESVPLERGEHPFLDVKDKGGVGIDDDNYDDRDLQKEFVARLKEKKDWQEPHHTKDADEVFKEVKKK